MPETSQTTQTATTYPTVEQYERWKARAESLDMSMSEFIQSMTEAGMKEFKPSEADRDEKFYDMRKQREQYYKQLEAKRAEVEQLEKLLQNTERGDIEEYLKNNPGVEWDEIIQHVMNDVPRRVQRHLDKMESEGVLKKEGEQYYFDAEG